MAKRKVCVITGSRAEYGLLYWLMKAIQEDSSMELQLLVTGSHFSSEHGSTYKIIEQDGFIISERVEMVLSSDSAVGIAKSIGLGIIGCADALERLKPNIIVLLGDRYEIFAAAQAAMVARIPIAHLNGGEATEGLIDEAIRHSITKMSQIHFVSSEPYRQRVIQLGEQPDKVFNVGSTGLDNIARLSLLKRKELESSLGFQLGKINFLLTYHPVTLSMSNPRGAMEEIFSALDQFPEAKIFITKPNTDTQNKSISESIDEYASKNSKKVFAFTSLGQVKYLSLMRQVDVVLGNSSSGLIEAPAFKKATVNIGDRQRGRLRASSVIDCEENSNKIITAIRKALSNEFQNSLTKTIPLYGEGGQISFHIKEILKSICLDNIIMKKFFDQNISI